ncbi:N-acetylglucosamine-6-phosphate deacetylase [Deinococcus hopiensis]|uniref:N-acetylglucosamine-6-phosphate deacetylase n=1 Tax=Deinococcus hopiensis TaxID=309885 RepID=UPI001FE4CC62|nr:amidohydrolase family protein [Deinococcus hopiensis]
MDGVQGIETLARFHVQHGTTTLLPTTMTRPWSEVLDALRSISKVRDQGVDGGASIWGAHLGGPFISGQRLGAQGPFHIDPTRGRVEEILELGVVRVVTLAPELPGAPEAAVEFARQGVRVSLGHTVGSYEDAVNVFRQVQEEGGTVAGTHLYNAMGTLAGRTPGVLGAVFAHPGAFAEVILDLHHVHPGAFAAAYSALPQRLMLITDAMRAAGQTDEISELGGQRVYLKDGQARLEDGTLAGSVLTLDQALRNAVQCGLSLELVSQMLSQVPARYLGLVDRGSLSVGLRADVVVLDQALNVREVWVEGVQTVCH